MVKTSGFISGMAEALGLPVATVQVAFRVLRDAGLMTTGARGVNAPDMVPLDAARLLIWALVTDRPADAATVVEDFGQLAFIESISLLQPNSTFRLDGGHFEGTHTLEQAIAELISIFIENGVRRTHVKDVIIDVFVNAITAQIMMNDQEHDYDMPTAWPEFTDEGESDDVKISIDEFIAGEMPRMEKHRRYSTKINHYRSVNHVHLAEIASVFTRDGG